MKYIAAAVRWLGPCWLWVVIFSPDWIAVVQAENWPCWRGPRGDGTSLEERTPTRWDGVAGENVAWKTSLPGIGHASPIVWGDRVFVVSCDESTGDRLLLALDRERGQVVWQRSVMNAPLEKKHKLNSFASGTPATDGELIYVSFLKPDMSSQTERTPGDLVVAAYDYSGAVRWQVTTGRFASVHGFCSSPVLFEDLVILNGDHDGDSYLVALDRATGTTRWKTPRDHKTRSYVTPIIREIEGRTQMVLSGSKSVASYDPRTGERYWYMNGPTEQFVASMVYNGQYLFLTAGFPEHHILAIRPENKPVLDDAQIVWRTTKACAYVPSPVICGDYFLVASDGGIGSCYEANSGRLQWTERMAPHYSASLVTAGGLVYFVADDGTTKVVRPGPKYELVAENRLGEYCYASPAIADGMLFLRGEKHLYCLRRTKAAGR